MAINCEDGIAIAADEAVTIASGANGEFVESTKKIVVYGKYVVSGSGDLGLLQLAFKAMAKYLGHGDLSEDDKKSMLEDIKSTTQHYIGLHEDEDGDDEDDYVDLTESTVMLAYVDKKGSNNIIIINLPKVALFSAGTMRYFATGSGDASAFSTLKKYENINFTLENGGILLAYKAIRDAQDAIALGSSSIDVAVITKEDVKELSNDELKFLENIYQMLKKKETSMLLDVAQQMQNYNPFYNVRRKAYEEKNRGDDSQKQKQKAKH